MALLLTLFLGLFIILGAIIVFLTKNNDRFVQFSISLAFGVITMLILTDLIPEAFEVIASENIIYDILYVIIGASIGFVLLSILDAFVPDHEDNLTTTTDDDRNFKHIGMVASIALVIHNIVEGMAIYLLVSSDLKAGLMACVGVGLHNIPLGMVIASAFYKSNKDKQHTILIILGISLSTFIGGLLISVLPFTDIMEVVESISLTVTLGMLLYILILELLPKVINNKDKKETISGIILGVILLLITLFI